MKVFLAGVIAGICCSPAFPQEWIEPGSLRSNGPPVQVTALFVAELTAAARSNSPALRAADARFRSGEADAAALRTWDDPVLSLGGAVGRKRTEDLVFETMSSAGPAYHSARLEMGFNASEEGDLIYGLEQKLPLFGKAKRARAWKLAEAEALGTRSDAAFQEIRKQAAVLIFAIALSDRISSIDGEEQSWLERQIEVAQERLRAGSGGLAEINKLRSEKDQWEQRRRVEMQRGDQLRSELNRRLGRSVGAPFPELRLPELWPALRDHRRLLNLALRDDPRILMSRSESVAALARVEATRRSRRPDVALGIEGRQFSGDGTFREGMFTASMNIPWFNRARYEKDFARDAALAEAAELQIRQSELEVEAEITKLTRGIDAARREAQLSREILLPRGQQSVDSARSAWISGAGNLAMVLESRRMLFEALRMEARGVSEQWTLLSELALCCGVGDLEALAMIEEGKTPPLVLEREGTKKETKP
ncbi:MAG: TolC family protein [Verrucomicrobia bacterium]|nr:TolC family protein [Verrucomicrobiota bacterium]